MGLREAFSRFLYGGPNGPSSVVTVPAEQRGWGASVIPYEAGRPVWPTRDIGTYRTEGYEQSATVYACVMARAKAVSAATVRVYRDEAGIRTEQPEHPLRRLMLAPNPYLSEAEFLLLTVMFMDVAGFALIEKARSAAGNVVELWHLRPDWAKPIPRDQAPPDWEYKIPGRGAVVIKAEDVLVVTGTPSPTLGHTGLSPIAVALREVGIENAATDFLKLFLENGGAPRYALVTPKEFRSQADADAVKERWQQAYGGYRNWVSVALLAGGLDLKQVGFNLEEMAYPELRRLTEAKICTAFGVPAILIGAQVGLDASTYSNFQEARRTFYEDTVVPLWARLDGALTRALLPEFDTNAGVSLEFDTESIPALQDDVNPAWQRATAAATQGLILIDEFRSEVGLPPLPGNAGQILLLPLGVQPIAPADLAAWVAPAAANAGEPAAAALSAGDVPQKRAITPLDAEQRAAVGVNARVEYARLARRLAPEMRRFWREQGKRIVGAATRTGAVPETRALGDIDWMAEYEALFELLMEHYERSGEAAFRAVSRQLGVEIAFDVANPNVAQVLDRLGLRIVDISETTRRNVVEVVDAALAEGVGVDKLAERLTGLFEETYRGRAMTVARTESMAAYAHASTEGYRQSGLVAAVELLDNPDHDTDPGSDGLTCAQRNGRIVPLELADLHIAAEHPNGTLALAPIVS